VSNAEFLLSVFWKAADKDAAFAQYLYERVSERLESGRGMDCDEYQALRTLAA
jgi:hypothetical protein